MDDPRVLHSKWTQMREQERAALRSKVAKALYDAYVTGLCWAGESDWADWLPAEDRDCWYIEAERALAAVSLEVAESRTKRRELEQREAERAAMLRRASAQDG